MLPAVFAVMSAGTWASSASASSTSVVPVVRCPTEFGISGRAPNTPAALTVSSSTSTGGLAAYTNTQLFLLGPRGMRCSGLVAVDGGSQVVVWPRAERRPGPRARSDGLTLMFEPACAGCKAEDACPFFTAFARSLGFPCTNGVPKGERVYRLRRNVALFEDPPGGAGSGWPSGGPDPANGVVGITVTAGESTVYRSTCTLPAAQHAVCTTSLNYVISRYG